MVQGIYSIRGINALAAKQPMKVICAGRLNFHGDQRTAKFVSGLLLNAGYFSMIEDSTITWAIRARRQVVTPKKQVKYINFG